VKNHYFSFLLCS